VLPCTIAIEVVAVAALSAVGGQTMSVNSDRFDAWIRSRFIDLNSRLEDVYFSQPERAEVEGVGRAAKRAIFEEGKDLVAALRIEGNTDEGFDHAFDLLGNLSL
jgi:hypothetical protein